MGSFENARQKSGENKKYTTSLIISFPRINKTSWKYPQDSSKIIKFMLLQNAYKHPNSPQQLPVCPSSFSMLSQLHAKTSSGTFLPFLAQQRRMKGPDLTDKSGLPKSLQWTGSATTLHPQKLSTWCFIAQNSPAQSEFLPAELPLFQLSTNYPSLVHKQKRF